MQRWLDAKIDVDEQGLIDESNEGADELLDEGLRRVANLVGVNLEEGHLHTIKNYQMLIAGFMVTSAIVYGANMIVAAILAGRR